MTVDATKTFVRNYFQNGNYDPSHDYMHVERVLALATTIYDKEQNGADFEIVQLAALLHDVGDHKYSSSEDEAQNSIESFLSSQGYPQDRIMKVIEVVQNVSYSKEVKHGQIDVTPELAIVQDADRLDAIGAIGAVRAFTFGGARNRPLYDKNTLEEDVKCLPIQIKSNDTLNHFGEKLLKIKGMMKTKTGAQMAQDRHQFMVSFIKQFVKEVQV